MLNSRRSHSMGISLNYQTKIINITKPASKVTVQDLVNTIRESECEVENISFEPVIDTVCGKTANESTSYTPLTVILSSEWQIQ